MPTLGFLKKKRTKEAKDPASTSQPNSPTTPTSDGFGQFSPSESAQSSAPEAASETNTSIQNCLPKATPEQSMNPGSVPYQHQQAGAAHGQQKAPTIHNLIHPPQHDGSHMSKPQANMNYTPTSSANGSAMTAAKAAVVQPTQARATKGKYTLQDFEILRTLGTGSFGRVHLVQSKHNQRFYAVKVLKKQQVVKMKQVEHTNDERKMLGEVKHPFLITLWGTFQDSRNLYMVMDFVEGGELFSLLRKSQVFMPLLLLYEAPVDDSSDSRTLWPNFTQRK